MVTIENQDILFTFTAIGNGHYQNRMFVKEANTWHDMPDTPAWGIQSWNRTLWNYQLVANPILKEWGCEQIEYRCGM
jgi:hypothetical protein